MTYQLLAHDGPHGFGVSLTAKNEAGDTTAGFVLQSFSSEADRDTYAAELAETFGFPLQNLNEG